MITLITAVPGSGKSLRMIGMILEFQKEGRKVYANIAGINVPDVLPSPDDWRETPEGSVVIYDEAQEIFPSNAKPGIVSDERLTSMERHRHSGHDLIFATQSPTFVHHHIRKLVGCHVHLYRPNGMSGANIYTWNHACNDPNDRQEQERADHLIWKFPKEHYPLYKSSTVHTHKFRFPRKIAFAFAFVAIGACWVAYSLRDGFALTKITEQHQDVAQGQPASAAAAPLVVPYQWSSTPAATPVAGCIASETHCQCYDVEMTTLALEDAQCRSVLGKPLPRKLPTQKSEGGNGSDSKKPPEPQRAPSQGFA